MEYTEKWGNILKPYKNITKNYLEIGLFKGITLPWWKEYFNCEVYGIDRDLSTLEIDTTPFHVYQMEALDKDQADLRFNSIKFDVIVDDSTPEFPNQIFNIYQKYLNCNGIYIIETYKNNSQALLSFGKLSNNFKNFKFNIGISHLSNRPIVYGYKIS